MIVTCSWESASGQRFEGRNSIWGCTLDARYTDEDVERDHGMREDALADLNEQLADAIERGHYLARELRPARRKPRKS